MGMYRFDGKVLWKRQAAFG